MNNSQYKYLLENLNTIILHVKDNQIKYSHIGFNNCSLLSEQPKFGNKLSELIPVELVKVIKEKLKETEKNQKFDFEIKNNEESEWFLIKMTKISESEMILTIDDISERKTEEENFRQIFENAIMGIYKSTPGKGRHLSVNPELARIYGYQSSEELQNSITDISSQLYVDKHRREELLQRLYEEDSNFGFESQLYNKDGELIWISENAKAVKDSNGNVKFIVGTVKDITKQKKAEEKIRRAKEDWERTFDAIDNIVIILDKELKIQRMNKTALNNIDKLVSENFSESCAKLFNCAENECVNCPAKKTSVDAKAYSEEIENLNKGKTYHATSSPILNEEKELIGIVFVAKDITEEKKLRKQAEYRLQQVIQTDKLKSLGEVVAGVAHEINNPNAYITTNISLLEESWKEFKPLLEEFIESNKNLTNSKDYYEDLIDETVEIIHSIKDGSSRIKNVVSNLKDFSRVNSAGTFSFVNVNEVIEKGLKIIGSNLRRAVGKINLELEENLPQVKAHFQKLEQVFINFVLNSSQAIPEKSKGKINISTSFVKRLNAILIEVADNGSGIKKEVLPKLFDPFFTTRRDIGGSGLGLSISYEIIQEHKGVIAVHSKENVGTRFSLFLPVEENELNLNPKILCVDERADLLLNI